MASSLIISGYIGNMAAGIVFIETGEKESRYVAATACSSGALHWRCHDVHPSTCGVNILCKYSEFRAFGGVF